MDVSGLMYVEGFVHESDERDLLAAVDAEPWLADLKRRVQHYGYRGTDVFLVSELSSAPS